jgi:hypothetical protein
MVGHIPRGGDLRSLHQFKQSRPILGDLPGELENIRKHGKNHGNEWEFMGTKWGIHGELVGTNRESMGGCWELF